VHVLRHLVWYSADVLNAGKTCWVNHDGPVGFQNSATGPDLRFYATRSYSLIRPPRTGRRLIRSWERSAAGDRAEAGGAGGCDGGAARCSGPRTGCASWQDRLSAVKGVYLLVDKRTGEQYVSSAKGEDSHASILQVVDEQLPDHGIEEVQSWWKRKLMTREHGLNRN
jgi:hypothetical protein